jgi:hypothetical protein
LLRRAPDRAAVAAHVTDDHYQRAQFHPPRTRPMVQHAVSRGAGQLVRQRCNALRDPAPTAAAGPAPGCRIVDR